MWLASCSLIWRALLAIEERGTEPAECLPPVLGVRGVRDFHDRLLKLEQMLPVLVDKWMYQAVLDQDIYVVIWEIDKDRDSAISKFPYSCSTLCFSNFWNCSNSRFLVEFFILIINTNENGKKHRQIALHSCVLQMLWLIIELIISYFHW